MPPLTDVLNTCMEFAVTPWPINKYGTSWRYAVLYFDWQDQKVVLAMLDGIDPRRITIRCRAVAAIEFENIGDMVMHRLAETLPTGGLWDGEKLTVVFDPCDDPEAMVCAVNDEETDEPVAFSIFGLAVLDLADETIYRQLSAALEECHGRFAGEVPVIEF